MPDSPHYLASWLDWLRPLLSPRPRGYRPGNVPADRVTPPSQGLRGPPTHGLAVRPTRDVRPEDAPPVGGPPPDRTRHHITRARHLHNYQRDPDTYAIHLIDRVMELEAELGRTELDRLERIEAKLDQLLEAATP